ncbi:hypothetical protein F0521_15010 [Ferrimonas sp. YFM]|nr:hypothetical protein F0521_15010 [Ferrimonas sp. YFM]
MKKMVITVFTMFLGLAAYTVMFTVFYDSWFPYYYEDYISYFFVAGVILLLFMPVVIVMYKLRSISENSSFSHFEYYCQSVIFVNAVTLFLCFLTVIYMLNHGSFIGGPGQGSYEIVPVER